MKKLYLLFIPVFLFILSGFCTAQINYINNEPSVPGKYILYQNYPNPFNPTTQIKYSLPKAGFVTVKVYNSLGNEVATLVNETAAAGVYNIVFEGNNLSSGVYYLQLKANNFLKVKKMILLK